MARTANRGALTPRERDILGLLLQGLTNREIAGRLLISDATVKSHLSTAYRKLGVANRTEAALAVYRRGELI
jgi:DNA-binding NarL/FixJ family response regulator